MLKKNDLYLTTSNMVAILYDIENSPYEMLNYALGKAEKISNSSIKVVSDWQLCSNRRKWNRLLIRKGLSFIQVERKIIGKNSLDIALFEGAMLLQQEGIQRFIIVTSDTDFVGIVECLRTNSPTYILGIGGINSNEKLRTVYDKFLYYPPPEWEANKSKIMKPSS